MVKLTDDSLYDVLQKKGLKPLIEPSSKAIYLNMRILNLDVPLFLGIRSEGQLLQLIAYFPYELNPKAVNDVARLLHLLNREVDIPGFGMDETQKLMFFRCVIPCLNGILDSKQLDLYLATTRIACETFMEAIGVMATGKANIDDMLKKKDGS